MSTSRLKRVLFIAPQPFFEERGTPIAVRLLLETLAKPGELEFDLVTYAPGQSMPIAGVRHLRICSIPGAKTIRPGLSLSKLIADFFLLCFALKLVLSAPKDTYARVHAVEEGAFIALLIRWLFGIPYVYDMDSSIADQVVEKLPAITPAAGILRSIEQVALSQAQGVIAVCPALVDRAKASRARWVELLTDVSLLEPVDLAIDLRAELSLPTSARIALYVGNLERYQGVDLLLEAWKLFESEQTTEWHLVIIGTGADGAITRYRSFIENARLKNVHLAGPRPVKKLSSYLAAADVLLSPRLLGNNTPMKIYSYLDAGKAIIATDLPTHTQVLTAQNSMLVPPTAAGLNDGLQELARNDALRAKLAGAAKECAEAHYTRKTFEQCARSIYMRVFEEIPS